MGEWVNLDDLLKLRQNVRLLDEGGWEEDIQAIPVEAIKGLFKLNELNIVRCKDCRYAFRPVSLGTPKEKVCFLMNDFPTVTANDFCSRGARKE
jgi:hypothetical protein